MAGTWIFAPVAAAEANPMIEAGDASLQPDLCEQEIMDCAAGTECDHGG